MRGSVSNKKPTSFLHALQRHGGFVYSTVVDTLEFVNIKLLKFNNFLMYYLNTFPALDAMNVYDPIFIEYHQVPAVARFYIVAYTAIVYHPDT